MTNRWETAVLPLLREERGSGTSTVEERVIGAGLQALEKNEDGPAVKKLFYAFAVTQVSGPLGCDLWQEPHYERAEAKPALHIQESQRS